jgi:hypothetical protein
MADAVFVPAAFLWLKPFLCFVVLPLVALKKELFRENGEAYM